MTHVRSDFFEVWAIQCEGSAAVAGASDEPEKPCSPYVFNIQCSMLSCWKLTLCAVKCASSGDHCHAEGAPCIFARKTKGACLRCDNRASQKNGFAESHASSPCGRGPFLTMLAQTGATTRNFKKPRSAQITLNHRYRLLRQS